MRTFKAAVLPLLLASACTVGPDYSPPAALYSTAPLGLVEQGPIAASDAGVPAESLWWRAFDDELLSDLIDDAISANHDIRVASGNVRLARALRKSDAGLSKPQISAGASYARLRGSENGQIDLGGLREAGVADVETNLLQVGFDASWEIDIFGGNRRRVEAADAKIGSALENRRDVLLSIVSELARNYGELRGSQLRIEALERRIAVLQSTLQITTAKYETGIGPQLDVQRAQANLSATQSQIPDLRLGERAAAYRIAVLTGRQPSELSEILSTPGALPNSVSVVPVGLQSDLLRRRPDVRRAERELAAATAEIGVAKADFFPRFSLTGGFGQESTSLSNLFSSGSNIFSIIPSITFPLFNGGRLRAQLEAANAGNDIALAQFEQAVLLAVEDFEVSLVRYVEAHRRATATDHALQASRNSERLARDLYKSGLSDFISVLDAERQVTELELQSASDETEKFISTIAVYKSLGGGWETIEL
jgi:NodT family efflux transporter outer membrane factor (OMF) lipoprotein